MSSKGLLHTLQLPGGVKRLNAAQMDRLCREIRATLIDTLSKTGGHLASNLGTVELTVALHAVFDLPHDQIVWDVGHQCYAHKLLTGRLSRFSGLRREGGISGFPRASESEYDAFVGGHASNSVSAACGLAKAKTLQNDPHHVIAVVGDGAFTGGMIYEGLNNAGRASDRLIVVLNDNDMSISPSVGSLARYLAAKRASSGYIRLKGAVEGTLRKIPVVGEGIRDAIAGSKTMFRQAIYHSNFFEDFGFDYLGPVDGHDIPVLKKVLEHARSLNKPVIVHVNTIKGKGYSFAERNPSQYHGVGRFDRVSGRVKSSTPDFSGAFGQYLIEAARKDARICAITAAMQSGTGLQAFAGEFAGKNRFFDVGIAEEHAVTFAAGLAAGGMLPVFAVYSTFLQRGFDQLIHDAAIERRHIVLAVDRAGVVGEDGETHQGLFDAAFLSTVPQTTVYSPVSFAEQRWAFDRALYHTEGIAAVRYPRGGELPAELLPAADHADYYHEVRGGGTLLITYGREYAQVHAAAQLLSDEGKAVDILRLNRIWPIPGHALEIARKYATILFVEEGVRAGGIGERFLSALADRNYRGRMRIAAVDQPFIPQMTVQAALVRCGLDAQSIAQKIKSLYF